MKCLMLIRHAERIRSEPIPQRLIDAMGNPERAFGGSERVSQIAAAVS
jgi:hypothetical protein